MGTLAKNGLKPTSTSVYIMSSRFAKLMHKGTRNS